MRLRNANWLKVAVAAAACVVLLAGDMALASNMGFKMNKVIQPFLNATTENWTALPYRHPYVSMQDVCAALGLTNGNSVAKVIRLDPTTGNITSWNCSTTAGNAPCLLNDTGACTFPGGGTPAHVKRAGLIITNNLAAGGIIVGSHQSNPPGTITLKARGAGAAGQNYFSVPYHTTSANMQEVCLDLGLLGPLAPIGNGTAANSAGKVERRNALNGNITSWDCNATGTAPAITLGEALRVSYTGNADVNVAAGHPAHF